jgi:hypothetical protein
MLRKIVFWVVIAILVLCFLPQIMDSLQPNAEPLTVSGVVNINLMHYTVGWSAWEIWQGQKVVIPDVWVDRNYTYVSTKFQDAEKEIYLDIGWKRYDEEAEICIGAFKGNTFIVAEVGRMGSAEIHVLYKGTEIVCFPACQIGVLAPGYYIYKIPLSTRQSFFQSFYYLI